MAKWKEDFVIEPKKKPPIQWTNVLFWGGAVIFAIYFWYKFIEFVVWMTA